MLFILHRVGIVILSTKTTVTLVPVDMMNTINLNFPSPRSEPREVIEVGSVHKHVKVLMADPGGARPNCLPNRPINCPPYLPPPRSHSASSSWPG